MAVDAQARQPDRTRILAPPPLLNAAGLLLGIALDARVPVGRMPLGFAERALAGGALALAGIALAVWALAEFRRAGTTPNPFGGSSLVVPSGPYRRTRNPMYVGMLASYLGVALAWGGVWPFLMWPAVALALHFGVVRREEAYLARKFGEEYERYRSQVGRWL